MYYKAILQYSELLLRAANIKQILDLKSEKFKATLSPNWKISLRIKRIWFHIRYNRKFLQVVFSSRRLRNYAQILKLRQINKWEILVSSW